MEIWCINRDVVWLYNEVMMVIGVVEFDNGFDDVYVMFFYWYNVYEDRWGNRLFNLGGVFDMVCVWGVNGMR